MQVFYSSSTYPYPYKRGNSRLQESEAGCRLDYPPGTAIHQLRDNHFHDVPGSNPCTHTTGNRFFLPSAGHVHMKAGLAIGTGEQRPHPRHLVNMLQARLHRHNGLCTIFCWSDNQPAAVIGSAYRNQRGGMNAMLGRKRLDHLMHDIAIFQANHEHTSLSSF